MRVTVKRERVFCDAIDYTSKALMIKQIQDVAKALHLEVYL